MQPNKGGHTSPPSINQNQLIFNSNMENQFYFVYAILPNGDSTEKLVTDEEHLDTCINTAKSKFNTSKVHYNKAVMCYDGYLVQSEYMGTK